MKNKMKDRSLLNLLKHYFFSSDCFCFRFRVTFNCDRHNDDTCLEFLPFQKQQWAAYMGTHANSHMYPRK